MTTDLLSITATVYRPCRGFTTTKFGQHYAFTVALTDQDRHYAPTPKGIVACVFNNLRFKWKPLGRAGSRLRIDGYFHKGPKGGIKLHIEAIEVLEIAPPKLTNVSAKQLKQWKKASISTQ